MLRGITVTMCGGLFLLLALPGTLSARPAVRTEALSSARESALETLRERSFDEGDTLKVHEGAFGVPRYLSGVLSDPCPEGVDPETHVRRFLASHSALYPIELKQLRLERVMTDMVGGQHLRFVQYYRGVPVFNAVLVAHADALGVIRAVTGNVAAGIDLDARPGLSKMDVTELVDSLLEGRVQAILSPELLIYPSRAGHRLAYQVSAIVDGYGPRVLWLDATSGDVIWAENPIREGSTTGTGIDLHGDNVSINVFEGKRFPEDVSQMFSIYTQNAEKGNFNLVDFSAPELGKIYTYTANETFLMDVDYVYSKDNSFDDTQNNNHVSGVTAHEYFREILDFYNERWDRKGLDDNALSVAGVVEIKGFPGYPMECNAGWLGYGFNFMIFGMGGECFGVEFEPFSIALDVIGHELNHAVDEFTINLGYNAEAGALNEGFADVFGYLTSAYYEEPNWLMGEQLFVNPAYPYDAIRSFEDPTLYAQPARMEDYYTAPVSYDAGGVHYNSGIMNKAFYLIVEGGKFNDVIVPPINKDIDAGRWIAADIFWDVMNSERVSSISQFNDLRDAAIDAAEGIYPEGIPSIEAAFQAVGVVDDIYPTSAQDQAEPNDYPGLAMPIAVGGTASQYIWARNDADIYQVELSKGRNYVVSLSELAFDAHLAVYSSGPLDTLMAAGESDNPDNQDEVIQFSPKNAGTYYIEVIPMSNDGSRTKPYHLSVGLQ